MRNRPGSVRLYLFCWLKFSMCCLLPVAGHRRACSHYRNNDICNHKKIQDNWRWIETARRFIITTVASDFVPSGHHLPFQDNENRPQTQSGTILIVFFPILQLRLPPAKTSCLSESYKKPNEGPPNTTRQGQIDRTTERPNDWATERSNDRTSDRPFQRQKSLFSHTDSSNLFLRSPDGASERTIEQAIPYRTLPIDGLVGYREANRIYLYICLYLWIYLCLYIYVCIYIYIHIDIYIDLWMSSPRKQPLSQHDPTQRVSLNNCVVMAIGNFLGKKNW